MQYAKEVCFEIKVLLTKDTVNRIKLDKSTRQAVTNRKERNDYVMPSISFQTFCTGF